MNKLQKTLRGILLLLLAVSTAALCAQQPTKKQMEEMMKQAKKEMDKMSPQDKKTMDSLGIKMPSFNTTPDVSDQQLKKAADDENRLVPIRDAARINSILKTPLNAGTVSAYINNITGRVNQQLLPEARTKGQAIFQVIQNEAANTKALPNTAAALWMMGRAELAIYVAGKACATHPADLNALSNYAAMLSMTGAAELSIPLLDYLNKRVPKNSTILNNLGQAWFALGEINQANKYLDSAILLFPAHPQANFTKCFIEQSRGNKQAAVAAMKKSISQGYTKEKEDILRKLGYPPDGNDVRWAFPHKPDPLGLERFHIPAYPMTVEQCIAANREWEQFKLECQERIASIVRNSATAQEIMIRETDKRNKQYITQVKNALRDPSAAAPADILPAFADKASLKIKLLASDKDGSYNYQYRRALKRINEFTEITLPALQKQYEASIDSLNRKESEETGEGKSNVDYCPRKQALTNAFLRSCNSNLEQLWNDYYNIQRRYLNELTYWNQFLLWPDQFEIQKLSAQKEWLNQIKMPHYISITAYDCSPKEIKTENKPLAQFEDVNCQYHSVLNCYVGTITTDCNRMTTELNLKFLKLGLTQDLNKESFGDQFLGCSIEISEGVDKGFEEGPLKAEVSLKGGIRIEFDKDGLKDVVLKGEASVGAGTRVMDELKEADDKTKTSFGGVSTSDLVRVDHSVDVGVKGEISIISGKASAESTGMLEGVFKKSYQP